MRTTAAILLACLLLAFAEGFSVVQNGRCLCIDAGMNSIRIKDIANVQVHEPSNTCEKKEIIVTLKGNGEKRCLNPKSKFAKYLIEGLQRSKRNVKRMGWKA